MRFHVVGVGAIGSLVAHGLRTTLPKTHDVVLIHKNFDRVLKSIERENRIELEFRGIKTRAYGFLPEELPPVNDVHSAGRTASYVGSGHIDSLFVTTKAYHVFDAIRRLLPRLSINSTIVLLQNGMGLLEELFVELFPVPDRRPNIILATNTHGVYPRGFFDFVHSGIGTLEFGIVSNPATPKDVDRGLKFGTGSLDDITSPGEPDFERFRSLRNTVAALQAMTHLQPSWKPIDQIELAMRRKLVVNSVINPLTALLGCRNGAILNAPGASRITSLVCREASAVFAAQTRNSNMAWVDRLQQQGVDVGTVSLTRLPSALRAESLEQEVARVVELTKDNISSMLGDVRHGRPTEIDYMNGHLLNLGRTYHVRAPTIGTLRNLVYMRSAIPIDE